MGYPNIAQSDVDDSTLEITKMDIMDPTPDSLRLNITQELGTDSSFHPKFDEWDATVLIGGSEAPFMNLKVPAFQANDGTEILIEQKVNLDDVDAFSEYSKAVMLNETVSLIIRGNPKLQEGALPKIDVDYDKTITMKGRFALFFNLCSYQSLIFHCRSQLLEGIRSHRLQDSLEAHG